MNPAIFGDLHGNFMAAYDAAAHWEHHHEATADTGLLTGDQGLFFDRGTVDGATVRHYRRDPTELCGALYANGVLKTTHPTYFVRANHEDCRPPARPHGTSHRPGRAARAPLGRPTGHARGR